MSIPTFQTRHIFFYKTTKKNKQKQTKTKSYYKQNTLSFYLFTQLLFYQNQVQIYSQSKPDAENSRLNEHLYRVYTTMSTLN